MKKGKWVSSCSALIRPHSRDKLPASKILTANEPLATKLADSPTWAACASNASTASCYDPAICLGVFKLAVVSFLIVINEVSPIK